MSILNRELVVSIAAIAFLAASHLARAAKNPFDFISKPEPPPPCADVDAPEPPPQVDDATTDVTIHANGEVTRSPASGSHRRLGIFAPSERERLTDPSVIVRIEGLSSVNPTPKTPSPPIWCGSLDARRAIDLDPARLHGSEDVWRVSIFVSPGTAKELGLTTAIPRPDVKAQVQSSGIEARERAAIYRRAASWHRDVPQLALVPDWKPGVGPPAHLREIAEKAAKEAAMLTRAELGDELSEDAEAYPVARSGLVSLAADEAQLAQTAKRVATSRTPADLMAFKELWSRLEEEAKGAPEPDESHCRKEWTFNVVERPELGAPWPLGVFELPTSDAAHTVALPATGVAPHDAGAPGAGLITAWATFVPADTDLTFAWVAGESTTSDVAKAIGSFVAFVFSRGPDLRDRVEYALMSQETNEDLLEPFLGRRRPELTSAVDCAKVLASAHSRVQLPLRPLATYESRARTSNAIGGAGLLADRSYTVYACKGTCVVAGDARTVLSQGRLRAPPGFGLTLLGSFSYDLAAYDEGPSFGDFAWRTTSLGSTEALLEVQRVPRRLRSFSASLLLTLLFPEGKVGRFGVGVGPSATFGDGGGALRQWTATFLYRPAFGRKLADRIFFTAGFGFRLIDQPRFETEGNVIAVDRMNQSLPMPPGLQLETTAVPVFTFGLGLDLALLGDAAGAIFGAKSGGGGK